MFEAIVQRIVRRSDFGKDHKRRRAPRRVQDHCIAQVGGRAYPVENWSQGGVLIFADDKHFGLGEKIDLTLKFRLHGRILNITQKARVVRKGVNKVAFQFSSRSKNTKQKFQEVLRDHVANEFV